MGYQDLKNIFKARTFKKVNAIYLRPDAPIYIHRVANSKSIPRIYEIILIELKEPFNFSVDHFSPGCLQDFDIDLFEDNFYFFGYFNNLVTADILIQVECEEVICTKSYESVECKNAGSGLLYQMNDKFYIVGILVDPNVNDNSLYTCNSNVTNHFAPIYLNLRWIESFVHDERCFTSAFMLRRKKTFFALIFISTQCFLFALACHLLEPFLGFDITTSVEDKINENESTSYKKDSDDDGSEDEKEFKEEDSS